MLERLDILEGGRKELRRDVRLTCDVHSDYWDDSLPFNLIDLSPSGAFVESQLPLGLDDELEIGFSAPRTRVSYRLRARVVRSSLGRRAIKADLPGMGIEFLDLRSDARRALTRCLVGIPPRVPSCALGSIARPNASVKVGSSEFIWVEELLTDELGKATLDLSAELMREIDGFIASPLRALAPLLTAGRA